MTRTIDVRVTRRRQEAEGVCAIELQDVAGRELPAFTSGAHVDLVVRDGLVRQYSLCSSPQERSRYEIGVLRCPRSRGGSAAVHETLHEGAIAQISEPRNLFPLVPARRSLLLAGGIGITPILSMAGTLHGSGAQFGLHYSARSPARAAFRERLLRAPFSDRVRFHFSDGGNEHKLDPAALLAQCERDTHLYVCGPAGYLEAITSCARQLGFGDAQIHLERFAPESAASADGSAFELQIASSGRRLSVPPGRTALEVLTEAGIDVPMSCEQGICGTCLTRVVAGVPDHRDTFLTDQEHARNDQMAVCCSRARSPVIVLDL
ncbi:PDR/VanB family oxidoreductase [Ramlibacter sp. Leaf400]|uniref:PDR/VanB family oxidoreductase n=1 Tax=Ramlibacter sp. Leaf400 TaxID=1736365 RepID=UPI0006FAC161|nr:PDR/VanB family oxidoreductase [Ramlibacter sp. Leaf400]KQT11283.1 Vanillate O-demethylase oxidoreductase [Ramlibacter sp. Leaf400]